MAQLLNEEYEDLPRVILLLEKGPLHSNTLRNRESGN